MIMTISSHVFTASDQEHVSRERSPGLRSSLLRSVRRIAQAKAVVEYGWMRTDASWLNRYARHAHRAMGSQPPKERTNGQ